MFQIISIVCIAAAAAAAAVHYVVFARRKRVRVRGEVRDVRRYNLWERLLHAVLALSFVGLAVTGFIPALCGDALRGVLLMVHCTAAPVFAAALAAMALTWAESCRFEAHDLECLKRCRACCPPSGEELPAGRFDACEKIFFWVSALLGVVVVLSMILCMVKLFGTCGQDLLLEVHRYSALALLVVTGFHAYRTTLAKPGTWRALLSGTVSENWARRHHPIWWRRISEEEEK